MYHGHKSHSDGDLLYVVLGGLILACLALPILGVYWLLAGKNDVQRIIGLIIVIICCIGCIGC